MFLVNVTEFGMVAPEVLLAQILTKWRVVFSVVAQPSTPACGGRLVLLTNANQIVV